MSGKMPKIKPVSQGVIDRLHDPKTQTAALHEFGEWIISTCLLFGTGYETAYTVAGIMLEGLSKKLSENP